MSAVSDWLKAKGHRMTTNEPTPPPPPGELRAWWREEHLCFRCGHYAVCKMAGALDQNLLVVISHCLAFESAEPDEQAR